MTYHGLKPKDWIFTLSKEWDIYTVENKWNEKNDIFLQL